MSEDRCGAFPDPMQVPERFLGPELPTCEREAGHRPPHRAFVTEGHPLPVRLEWDDPEYFAEVMRGLEAEFGRYAIRMWVERAPDAEQLKIPKGVGSPFLVPGMGQWGPLPPSPPMVSLAEFERAYGLAEPGPPTYTVDKYGGMYEMSAVPILPGWRGRWQQFQCTPVYHAGQDAWRLYGRMAGALDRAWWACADAVWRITRRLRR